MSNCRVWSCTCCTGTVLGPFSPFLFLDSELCQLLQQLTPMVNKTWPKFWPFPVAQRSRPQCVTGDLEEATGRSDSRNWQREKLGEGEKGERKGTNLGVQLTNPPPHRLTSETNSERQLRAERSLVHMISESLLYASAFLAASLVLKGKLGWPEFTWVYQSLRGICFPCVPLLLFCGNWVSFSRVEMSEE